MVDIVFVIFFGILLGCAVFAIRTAGSTPKLPRSKPSPLPLQSSQWTRKYTIAQVEQEILKQTQLIEEELKQKQNESRAAATEPCPECGKEFELKDDYICPACRRKMK